MTTKHAKGKGKERSGNQHAAPPPDTMNHRVGGHGGDKPSNRLMIK